MVPQRIDYPVITVPTYLLHMAVIHTHQRFLVITKYGISQLKYRGNNSGGKTMKYNINKISTCIHIIIVEYLSKQLGLPSLTEVEIVVLMIIWHKSFLLFAILNKLK